jgi:hypothetical protein
MRHGRKGKPPVPRGYRVWRSGGTHVHLGDACSILEGLMAREVAGKSPAIRKPGDSGVRVAMAGVHVAEKGQPLTILAQERSATGLGAVVGCPKRSQGCWVKESRYARHAGTHPHDVPP